MSVVHFRVVPGVDYLFADRVVVGMQMIVTEIRYAIQGCLYLLHGIK